MTRPAVTLHGYRFSVYTRIARLALELHGVPYDTHEVDPFSEDTTVRDFHPLGRVPILTHGEFRLYETRAITRYVAAEFGRSDQLPLAPKVQARVEQVISIIDAYGYVPMMRQVFAHRVFRPFVAMPGDPEVVAAGVAASRPVLAALEDIAHEGLVLTGADLTSADLHLAPMIDYFQRATEGAALLAEYKCLSKWWRCAKTWPVMARTDPGIAGEQQR